MLKWVLVVIIVIYSILLPKIASAAGSLEVQPAYSDVVLTKPEEEKTILFKYKNTSSKTVSLEVFPIDFKQQDEKGGIGFLGKDSGSYSYSLSSFLTFEKDRLEIDPGQEQTLKVTIKNRLNISPGGHYAAVVARLVNETKDKTVVSPALSSLIYMRKEGGENFNLSIRDIDWPRSLFVFSFPNLFQITFQNEGNTHLVPYGRGEVRDIFGRLLYKGVVNTQSTIVMPESRRIIPIEFKKINQPLPITIGRLSIRGNDSIKKTTFIHEESFIYVNPKLLLLILALLIIGVWRITRKLRK